MSIAHTLPPGSTVDGKYQIVSELGRGGMGVVFRAIQLTTGREVALKTMLPTKDRSAERTERFERELQVICNLQHPNTITVFDAGGLADGTLYFAMELLEGRSLDALLATQNTLDPERTRRILMQTLKGLAEAHAKGIVHRDLKPENIYLCEVHGEDDYVKVLDFGIAKALGADNQRARLTAEGATFGTPRYMAPEQLNDDPITPATDIYALGHVAYEMLSGESAYGETTLMALIARKLKPEPPPMDPAILDGPLGGIIARATAFAPKDRYQSCEQMLADLDRAGTQPIPIPAPAPKRRWGLALGLVAVVIVGLLTLVGVGAGAWFYTQSEDTPERITIVVTSDPSGALVYDGDEKIGKTPLTVEKPRIEGKKWALKVRKKGYRTAKTSLDMSQNGTASVALQKSSGKDSKSRSKDKDLEASQKLDKDLSAAERRAASARSKAKDKLKDADEKIKDTDRKLKDADSKIQDANRKVNDANRKVEGANQKVNDSNRKVEEANQKIRAAEKKKADALADAQRKRAAAEKKRAAAERKAAAARKKAADAREKAKNPF